MWPRWHTTVFPSHFLNVEVIRGFHQHAFPSIKIHRYMYWWFNGCLTLIDPNSLFYFNSEVLYSFFKHKNHFINYWSLSLHPFVWNLISLVTYNNIAADMRALLFALSDTTKHSPQLFVQLTCSASFPLHSLLALIICHKYNSTQWKEIP